MDEKTLAKQAKKIYVNMQIQEVLPLEKYEIYVKPDFDSASWRFHNGKHQIVIGSDIFSNLALKEISNREKALYMHAYLHHELAHSIWTDKDLNAVDKKLKKLRISFSMFNLFEDARIEEKMRKYIKRKFNWLEYETISTAQNPIDIFFYLIQAEHDKIEIKNIEANLDSSVAHHFDIIKLFYAKAIKCQTQEELIELLKKWYDKFPNTPSYEQENCLKSYIYSMESKYVEDEAFEELIEGLEDLLSGESTPKEENSFTADPSSLGICLGQKHRESLLVQTPIQVAFSKKTRDLLLHKMQKIFLSPARMSATILPSKRLSIKNIVAKNQKIFKRRDTVEHVKKSITIVLDLSGSMYEVIEHMRLIIDVLDKMVQKNLLDVTLILSGVSLGKSLWEKYTLPLKKDILEKIVPNFEAEGLHNAMSSNLNTLKESDFVWIFTDGMISEGPIDKNFYHKHSISTHAFYIGSTNYTSELEISFDHVICEKDVINLTNKIFTLVK